MEAPEGTAWVNFPFSWRTQTSASNEGRSVSAEKRGQRAQASDGRIKGDTSTNGVQVDLDGGVSTRVEDLATRTGRVRLGRREGRGEGVGEGRWTQRRQLNRTRRSRQTHDSIDGRVLTCRAKILVIAIVEE